MCPKLLGLHKSEIQLLFILIIILILLTYYLKTINNRYSDYLYYTAFIYIIGLLSISILVNAVLNYNTYANKYLIYEPTHNYKNLMNNKHTVLNIMISRDNKLKDLFKIYTDKYNDKINSVNLTERASKFSSGMSLDKFISKIRKSIIADTNDNINNPTREPTRNQSLLHLQIQFYKAIYSYMIKTEDIRTLYPAIRVTDKYIESVTQGDPDNYNRFNNYKTSLISGKYVEKPTSPTQTSSSGYINQEYVYFFSLIRRVFVSTELNIKVKLKQLRLNYEYLIYNTTDKNYNDIKTEINFVSFLDNTNYNETQITRTNDGEDAKNYDYNRSYIDNAFDIYGEFLKEFRLAIVNLLTTTGISCEYTDYIEIQDKLQEYYNKMFSNAGSVQTIDKLVLKSTTQEPKIDIYRKVLELSMEQINSLMVKYMNIIKVYLKSFEVNPDVTPSADKLKTLQSADNKIRVVAEKIKNNFNIFNKEYNRHTNDNLLKMNFRIDNNYKPSKYEKFTSADMKKLNISTDNVSWSFIILIIIFAIILIEPTLI